MLAILNFQNFQIWISEISDSKKSLIKFRWNWNDRKMP